MRRDKKTQDRSHGAAVAILFGGCAVYHVVGVLFFLCKTICRIIGGMDNSLLRLEGEYSSIAENFWDVYLPVFEQDDGVAL